MQESAGYVNTHATMQQSQVNTPYAAFQSNLATDMMPSVALSSNGHGDYRHLRSYGENGRYYQILDGANDVCTAHAPYVSTLATPNTPFFSNAHGAQDTPAHCMLEGNMFAIRQKLSDKEKYFQSSLFQNHGAYIDDAYDKHMGDALPSSMSTYANQPHSQH